MRLVLEQFGANYKESLCIVDGLIMFYVKIGFAPATLSHRLLVRSASLSPLDTSTLREETSPMTLVSDMGRRLAQELEKVTRL